MDPGLPPGAPPSHYIAPVPASRTGSTCLALALGLLCCGAGDATWSGRNLVANPGFEAGREGWSIREESPYWGDFDVVEASGTTWSLSREVVMRSPEEYAEDVTMFRGSNESFW